MQLYDMPDERGHFGPYGGIFVAETLVEALEELRVMYEKYRHDPEFLAEFAYDLKHFVGRPSPIYHAKRWSDHVGGAQIYLKREDLNHTGAHKVNNTIWIIHIVIEWNKVCAIIRGRPGYSVMI